MMAQPGKPGGPAGPSAPGNPPSARALFNGRDPEGLLNAFAHPIPPGPQTSSNHSTMAMRSLFSDLEEDIPLVEVTGDFSFVASDGQLTDREFAALITNTKPRADVVPQQGSSVASVATLVPSEQQESAEIRKVSEFAALLIAPTNLPDSAAPRVIEKQNGAGTPIGGQQAPRSPQQFAEEEDSGADVGEP
jgi:hypothetical protein